MINSNLMQVNAIACIKGGKDTSSLSGKVEFYQKRNGVLIIANISGLPSDNKSGFFAIHIHDGGSCTGKDFSDTEGHYNPTDEQHPIHSGDLPPLLSCNGNAYLSVMTNRFCVRDIIGHTVVIHSGADDFHSQPSGNSGTKIACGVIKKSICC